MDNGTTSAPCGTIWPMSILVPVLAVITSVSDIRAALLENSCNGETFDVQATVDFALRLPRFQIVSASQMESSAVFFCTNTIGLLPGDIVRLKGRLAHEPRGQHPVAEVNDWNTIGKGKPTAPVRLESRQLLDIGYHYRPVVVSGELVDAVKDDIDPENIFLFLQDEYDRIVVSCSARDLDYFQPLIGASVVLRGTLAATNGGMRRHLNATVACNDRSDMTIVKPPPSDPFDAPKIDSQIDFAPASTLSRMGRRSVCGTVLAAWHERSLLIRDDRGNIFRVTLRNASDLPDAGERITVAGLPETDAFTIHITSAIFRREASAQSALDEPTIMSGADILADNPLQRQLQIKSHGQLIRMKGEFLGTATQQTKDDTINLVCDGQNITVICDCCTEVAQSLRRGSIIEIIGVGIVDMESPTTATTLPHIRGFSLVLRSAKDLRILSQPSWWTTKRLIGMIGALVVILLAILVWNRLLRRLIRRRSGELVRMELAKAISDLRIDERTRLAVDIHDSLSQTLTGVAFQIDAAEKTVGTNDAAASGFLVVARRTLASCREELRRCLWDLRNNTIGEPNFGKAVELVLQPHSKAVLIAVRFNVPRAEMTDSTAHAILSIVRELTVNAIRHGQAKHVRVAGEKRENVIRFSVADDGIGFDPAHRPGVDEGHFGLQGVHERLNRLGGKLDIVSTPGRGTKVTVEIGK